MNSHVKMPYFTVAWVLLLPLVVFFLFSEEFRPSEITSRLGWLILLVSLAYLVRLKLIFIITLLPFVVAGVADIFYTLTFSQQFQAELFPVLYDTNSAEALEFFVNFFKPINIIATLVYLIAFAYLSKVLVMVRPESFKSKLLVVAGIIMLIIASQQLVFYERAKDVVPGAIGHIYDGLNKQLKFDSELSKRPELLAKYEKQVELEVDKPQVYIVVVGESAARTHMSLYGYQRNTTPRLDKRINDLIVYEDVISPAALTYVSLGYMLTEKRVNNDLEFNEALSIAGLAKKAGFKTWWISSQDEYQQSARAMATIVDAKKYVNGPLKDSEVIKEVEYALDDPAQNKIIFVHTLGSHYEYSRRYTEEFKIFTDEKGVSIYTDEPSKKQIKEINDYDNSIVQTDYVLDSLIGLLEMDGGKISGLLYTSDHAEEIYDYKDWTGHELKRVSPAMVEVPFIVWVNDKYKSTFPDKVLNMTQNRKLPFINDDFFAFSLCFSGVKSEFSMKGISPCDSSYSPKKRLVSGIEKVYKEGGFIE